MTAAGAVAGRAPHGILVSSILLKTVRDRWLGWLVATVALGLLLWWGMAIYSQIDLSVYSSMPEVMLRMLGIPRNAGVGSLAYGAIYASYGAVTLAALALALGASAIAGEERDGTIGLLLANPRSRGRVLAEKAGAMVVLVALGALVLWVWARLAPALTGTDVQGMHPGALVVHLAVNAVFYGFLALAVGAWTGRSALAAGVSTLVMLVSWLGTGLLPMVEGWADAARVLPWHYYADSQPVRHGVAWADLAVLLAGAALLAATAGAGLARRDLRSRSVGESLVDRLRAHRLTRRAADLLAGPVRVQSIWTKTVSEHQTLVLVVSYVMVLVMGVVIGPTYQMMDQAVLDFTTSLPDTLLAMVGGADMSTPEGFYLAETFSIYGPAAVMVVTVTMGARALAGEEAHHTMGLLLGNPVSRTRVVLEKAVAMVVNACLVGLATWFGVALGSWLAGLGMSPARIAAISLLLTLLGLVFGGLALLVGAATGSVRVAASVAAGTALAAYLLNSFLPLDPGLAGLARCSPFHYYLAGDPLNRGLDLADAGVLAVLFAATLAGAVGLFGRRDLRGIG